MSAKPESLDAIVEEMRKPVGYVCEKCGYSGEHGPLHMALNGCPYSAFPLAEGADKFADRILAAAALERAEHRREMEATRSAAYFRGFADAAHDAEPMP